MPNCPVCGSDLAAADDAVPHYRVEHPAVWRRILVIAVLALAATLTVWAAAAVAILTLAPPPWNGASALVVLAGVWRGRILRLARAVAGAVGAATRGTRLLGAHR